MLFFKSLFIQMFYVALTLFAVAVSYAIITTIIGNVAKDILKIKSRKELLDENKSLKAKIAELEIELVDKKLEKEYNEKRHKLKL